MDMSKLTELLAPLELDSRHDLLDLHESGGLLTGLAEARFGSLTDGIADELGLSPAVRFAVPQPVVAARRSALLGAPLAAGTQLNEVLVGDQLEQLSRQDGYSLVRTLSDDYLGWLPDSVLVPGDYAVTHTVVALRAHAYSGPRVQSQKLLELSWGERLRVVKQDLGDFSMVRLPDGRDAFVYTDSLVEGVPEPAEDFVQNAESLLHAPYVWGGNTAWGLDCSGFAQLIHAMAGRQLPRDADEQFAAGEKIELEQARPGDAACYRGHIGIIVGPQRMIHATARGMRVREDHVFATEGLENAYLGTVRFG